MTKSEFLQAVAVRCSNMQGTKPFYTVKFALQMWETIEQYGGGTSEAMVEFADTSGITGPRSPLS